MTEKEYIFKLMFAAFLDIRIASHSQDCHTCFVLSDIFHSVPLFLERADKGEISYASIVKHIQEKCEERKCTFWLENANKNIGKKS